MTTGQDNPTPPRTAGQAEGTRDAAEQSQPSAPPSTPLSKEARRLDRSRVQRGALKQPRGTAYIIHFS